MAEEANLAAQESDDAAAEQENGTTDWQAKYEDMRRHSRDWESKAKENAKAAEELEKLKAAQLSEQEKANKRAEKAEAELNELKAKALLDEAASAAADELNVPVEAVKLLIGCTDPDELKPRMERLLKVLPAYPTRTDDGGTKAVAKKSTAQQFADAINLF